MNGTSATFEWRPSGPSRYNKTTSFRCLKDFIRIRENCEHTFSILIDFNSLIPISSYVGVKMLKIINIVGLKLLWGH